MPSPDRSTRLHYLDWLRGLAAVIMLQGHTFHSFTKTDLRSDSPFVLSQFLGGMPPAIFLFLTGVTLAFRMDADERKGITARGRIWSALSRAGYLFLLAFLFRTQLWAFGLPGSNWRDIFKVDILNCMGFAIAVFAVMAIFPTVERVRLCAALGLGIAAASPLVSQLDWSTVNPLVKSYLAPDYVAFGLFPWGAYLAFGLSAGSAIRALRDDQMDRAMQWSAIIGAGLIVGGQYASNLPYSLYSTSEFWLNSPALVLIKLGAVLWMLTAAFLWTRYAAPGGWSWVRQLGTTSLLVYWVHIELVYGRWLAGWKENLDNTQTVLATLAMIALMLAISMGSTWWKKWKGHPTGFKWDPFLSPRSSGD